MKLERVIEIQKGEVKELIDNEWVDEVEIKFTNGKVVNLKTTFRSTTLEKITDEDGDEDIPIVVHCSECDKKMSFRMTSKEYVYQCPKCLHEGIAKGEGE